jgi:hypothetical protein
MSSVIERRLLVNYRVDPEVAARLLAPLQLPTPLWPQLVNGWAVAGICLIRLGKLRPTGVPGWAGVRAVRSSFFDDARLFPPGSATLDCALLMRDIPATWKAIQPAFPS